MNTEIKAFPLYVIIGFLLMPLGVFSQKETSMLRDSVDDAIDLSNYLYNLNGFLPVLSPITEPAVGYGVAGAGLVFLPKKDTTGRKFKMPDIVGVAGGYTQNRTWFAGAGYAGFWNEDHIRYRGALGYGDVHLKFFRQGEQNDVEASVEVSLKNYFLLQQAIFRLGDSKFMVGGKYQLIKTEAAIIGNKEFTGLDPRDFNLLNSGIGLIAEYEDLNNLFSPTKGWRINFTYDQYLEILASDRNFGKVLFFMLYYQPMINNKWISGFRFESNLSTGDAPFYMLPYVSLRGVPAMRYQGKLTALIETEQEVMLNNRWSLVGFAGFGKTYLPDETLVEYSRAWNAGGGFRYLIARIFGLKMGLDFARGPEDWAAYIVVGSAWQK